MMISLRGLVLLTGLLCAAGEAPKKNALLAHRAGVQQRESAEAVNAAKARSWEAADLAAEKQEEAKVSEEETKHPMPDGEMNALVRALFGKSVPAVKAQRKADVKAVLMRAVEDGSWESAKDVLFANRQAYFAQPAGQSQKGEEIFRNFDKYVGAFRKKWRKAAGMPKATWRD